MLCIKANKLQVALLAAVKATLTSKFHISKDFNEADTKGTHIHVRCLGSALSSRNFSILQIYHFLFTNRNTVYLLLISWDTHYSKCFTP
jgi:hypothetical protein